MLNIDEKHGFFCNPHVPATAKARTCAPRGGALCCAGVRHALAFALLLLMAACASAPPVQQMSDARLALRSAEEAGAVQLAAGLYKEAQTLLEQAERLLADGSFRMAKDRADQAKLLAIEAREEALRRTNAQSHRLFPVRD